MKLKLVQVANDVTPQTVRTAITRFLDQLPIEYQIISGGMFEDDYRDSDFGEEFQDDESLTIGLKVKMKE